MAFELLQKGIVLKLVGYRIILSTAKVEVFKCSTSWTDNDNAESIFFSSGYLLVSQHVWSLYPR